MNPFRYQFPRNPFQELEELQRDLDRLFARSAADRRRPDGPRAVEFPPLSVWVGQDGVQVVAEVPGMAPEQIEISVLGNTLTISGERQPEEGGEGQHYHRRERGFGRFVRTVELPIEVDRDRTQASCRHGKLTVTLPRPEEAKPKQVKVAVN